MRSIVSPLSGIRTPFGLRDGASVYAILGFEPKFVLDFKRGAYKKAGTATTLGSAITHTRASSATLVNSSGTLVTVGNNVPRTGHHIYDGTAWVNEGILHESEARTNLVTNSGDLSAAGWAGAMYRGSVTSGSPFGTYRTLSPASTSNNMGGAQRYQIGKTISSGSTYVGWALVKYSAGSGWFDLNIYDTSKGNEKAWFDLQNGVVGTKESLIVDHGMVDYGDGWWLCWASAAAASGSGGVSYEVPNGDGLVTCSAGDVILIAGTQFELGLTPSSYISTAGTTVTRAADLLTVPAANLPYSSTNMSIQMDGKMTYADGIVSSEVEMYRWILSSSNYINSTVQAYAAKTGEPVFSQRQASSGLDSVVGSGNTYAPDTDVPFNLASRHGSTFINGAHEGTLLTANTTPTILPDLSASGLTLGSTFMGTIGQFRVWDEDLTDAGIVEAST